jgi:rhodanese-related sulfurtransferase
METLADIVRSNHKTLLDVRTPQEFNNEHIEGAINIPLQEVPGRIDEIKTMQQPIVVYCLSGGRSATAAGILQQAGIDEVYNGGGIGNMQLMLM